MSRILESNFPKNVMTQETFKLSLNQIEVLQIKTPDKNLMIEDVLLNLIYLYYPKNICPWDEKEKYLQSFEYKKLQSTLDFFESDENRKKRCVILKEFEDDLVLKDFEDFSRLDFNQDRCFTFFLNVVEEGEMYSISLHLSILMPYYVIRKGRHTSSPLFPKSLIEKLEREKVDTRKMDELILEVERIVEEKLLYKKFPSSLINKLIVDTSFGDIYLGYFTMFNAFFNNHNINEGNH
jgi:hypothetical protein